MMRCNTFGRSALYAAVAAAAWVPWIVVTGPFIGGRTAHVFYLVVTIVLYIAGLAPRAAQRVTAALVASAVAGGVALAVHSTAELVIGLAVLLGVARSGFFYRSTPARAVTTEVALLVPGLIFARFLASATLPSMAVAVWGFLLVQSLFFLVAPASVESWRAAHTDPFEETYRRAVALLERTGV